MSRTTIDYFGVPLDCTYDYEPGFTGSRIDPPYGPSADIESVLIGGVECLDLFVASQLAEIQAKLIAAHEDGLEAERQDHWDNERKERALGAL
jgi:hypothetical protein